MAVELTHIIYGVVGMLAVWLFLGGSSAKKEEAKPVPVKAAAAAAAPTAPKQYPAAPAQSTKAAAEPTAKPAATQKAPAAQPATGKAKTNVEIPFDFSKEPPVAKKADKKKAKKASKPKSILKPVVIDVAAAAEEASDSDSDDDTATAKAASSSSSSSSAPKKTREYDQDAAFGTSSSQDAMFDDASWNVVEKAPRTKKQAKADAKATAAAAAAASGGDSSPKVAVQVVPEVVTKAMQHHNNTAVQEQAAHVQEKNVEAAAPPVADTVTKTIQIESRKIGVVVGSKGVNLKAIQEAANVEIRILKDKEDDTAEFADVTITGETDKDVNLGCKSVQEMATKGYCLLLKGENFSEGSISVHASSLGEIVGKGGSTLRNIQDAFLVKINTPQGLVDRASTVPVKVGVVGDRNQVKKAKECIKQLSQWHHTEATHPGVSHTELELDAGVHKFVIGHKGQEIHHIQKNFHVQVYIPNTNSAHTGVLVVGEADNVAKAAAYVEKVIEKALAPKEPREEKPTEFEQREQARQAEEQADIEPWMRTYIKDPATSNVLDMDAFPAMS